MNIAITGASGFIGQYLGHALKCDGHRVIALTRSDFALGDDHLADKINGSQVVINLAGAPINRRWTEAYKRDILSSRVETTKLLVNAMEKLSLRPELFISTSAIGAFSSIGNYTESDTPNATDFLGKVSMQWEAEASRAKQLGVNTKIFRLALVLGHEGGLMKQLMLPFRLGLGGPLGDGKQHFSWIHIDDLVNAYFYVIKHQQSSDIFHLCAPNPITNQVFTQTLGAVLHRPTLFRVPGRLLKLIYGEGSEVMLSGQSVTSSRLTESGFFFRFPDITSALYSIVDDASNDNTGSRLNSSLNSTKTG